MCGVRKGAVCARRIAAYGAARRIPASIYGREHIAEAGHIQNISGTGVLALKRGELVHSVKGAQGGYQLARRPEDITAYDILASVELSLFEHTEDTVLEKAPEVDRAMQSAIFGPLQEAVQAFLRGVALSDLRREAEKQNAAEGLMFYI